MIKAKYQKSYGSKMIQSFTNLLSVFIFVTIILLSAGRLQASSIECQATRVHEKCRHINKAGDEYVGGWRYGQKHGYGKVTFSSPSIDGAVFIGTFNYGAKRKGLFVDRYSRAKWFNSFYVCANCVDENVHNVLPNLKTAFNAQFLSDRKLIQRNLKKLGYYNSVIDGFWGVNTLKALLEFSVFELSSIDVVGQDAALSLTKAALVFLDTGGSKPPSLKQDDRYQPPKPQENLREPFAAASGSAFSVSEDGYLVTNYHVVRGCEKIFLKRNSEDVPVVLINHDAVNDIAIIKADFTPDNFLTLSELAPSLLEDIYVAGYPFGQHLGSNIKVTKGIVSGMTGINDNFSNMQIDAALQPGNSGGPVLNQNGKVVGVAVAKLDFKKTFKQFGVIPENTNFAVKSHIVLNMLVNNRIKLPVEQKDIRSKKELGALISDSTYYISCWMTPGQAKRESTRRVLFDDIK